MLVAGAPQYTHRPPSRAKMARLVSGTAERCGTRTNRVSRTTEGTGSAQRTLWTTSAPSSRVTAFCDRTSTMARRWGTTHKGSNVALRINALATGPPWSVRHVARAGAAPSVSPVQGQDSTPLGPTRGWNSPAGHPQGGSMSHRHYGWGPWIAATHRRTVPILSR